MDDGRRRGESGDPFIENKAEISRANAFLLKRVALCAFINTGALSVISPFLSGFSGAEALYIVSAVLSGLLALFCYKLLDIHYRIATPLLYCLLAGLCAYAVALSSFYYPDIHGVTIIGIFVLVPILILDRAWRVNAVFFLFFAVSCVFAFLRKPLAIAVDDATTAGAFMVFGMLIGNYLRRTRLDAIVQQRLTELQRDVDALTGLPNRRVLFETLAGVDSGESGLPMGGVVMIDVDDFKQYNDRLGHQAGDGCLRRLGDFLADFCRENPMTVYRYGGEEFLGIWHGGEGLGDAARKLVSWDCGGDMAEAVSISVGYVERRPGVSSERLIGMADSALYEAKSRGKGQAVGYTEATDDSVPQDASYRQRK